MDKKDIKVYLIGRDLEVGKELVTVSLPTDEDGVFQEAIVLLATPQDAIKFLASLPEGNTDKIYETTIGNIMAEDEGLKYVLIGGQEEKKEEIPTLLV
ncbi:MAG: hypothetical protein ACRDCW_02635 [Sarcina sp.]